MINNDIIYELYGVCNAKISYMVCKYRLRRINSSLRTDASGGDDGGVMPSSNMQIQDNAFSEESFERTAWIAHFDQSGDSGAKGVGDGLGLEAIYLRYVVILSLAS